jgi:DNA modification methylase
MQTIICGDALEEMGKLEKHSVDMICCDLPYGETENKWDVKIDIKKLWEQMKRVCKLNANIILFCSTRFGAELIQHSGGCFCYDLVWEKSKAQGFLNSKKAPLMGHEMIYVFSNKCRNDVNREFNRDNREYAKRCVEYIKPSVEGSVQKEVNSRQGNYRLSHFLCYGGMQFSIPSKSSYEKFSKIWKLHKMEGYLTWEQLHARIDKVIVPKKIYNPQMTKGKPYKSLGAAYSPNYGVFKTAFVNHGTRYPKSVLKFPNPCKSVHPTQKPLNLCQWLIRTYSNPGDLVLDMTMGSGTSILAAKNEERAYIGIELDEKIFKAAETRING